MNNIEKIAIDTANQFQKQSYFDERCNYLASNIAHQAAIIGATEQKKIDDEQYKKLRALAYDLYNKAAYLSTDARGLHKAMDAFYHYINFEEKR